MYTLTIYIEKSLIFLILNFLKTSSVYNIKNLTPYMEPYKAYEIEIMFYCIYIREYFILKQCI